ncbi:TetR family transcriptional regulator [Actinomycetospora sp. NBRC 106375]|uniref:TetR/AcrR family transcriptional regulator n=1 Tax=Actinomycetospora sp. NBRC 106375 TaxID=3032207 RepID=UPI0024A3BD6F|nr:TetR family transcriptional regulator [Actinomycetospora sp. NBRC 106375]GLZ50253.1 TetR family transcriptional regulator [Actinomycetospora sp. NBRC 106375]
MTSSETAGRRGRRPGDSQTRTAILEAARVRFAHDGFRAATVRAIAADAGVDPALVMHYFGTKQGLFVAAMEFPLDPAQIVPRIVGPGIDGLGERLVRFLLGLVDELGEANPMLALVRSAVGHPDAARMMREFLGEAILDRVAAAVDADRPRLRADLCASQIVGILMARQVLALPELAAADREILIQVYGRTIQRYLTEPLESPAASR